VWPLSIAPYTVCIVPLTTSQDPNDVLMLRAQKLYDCLSEEACPDHVILDDRTYLSMGARVRDSERLGYPCTVIIGYKMGGEECEVRVRRDDGGVDTQLLTVEQVSQTVRDLYTRSVTLGL
jgi:prolyl-tRNA synthetase